MREIKFRVWQDDRMYWEPRLSVYESGSVKLNAWLKNKEYGILMQFTGLKDKFGRDIYEGDILNNGDNGSTNWFFSFHQGYFNLCDGYICESRPMVHALEYVYIIGNIYENPELLK